MASAVSRELQITFGAIAMGGTSEYEIHDAYRQGVFFDRFALSFSVIVRGDTEAAFAAADAAFVAGMASRDAAVAITLGATTMESWDPAANTGFNTVAQVEKGGDLSVDSGRARKYSVTIVGETPVSDQKEVQITVRFDAARRAEIIYETVWTASGVQTASARYLADSPAFYTSNNAAFLGGRALRLFSEEYRPDRTNKNVTARAMWREQIATNTASVLDHADIEDHTFQVRLNHPAPGDSGQGIVRLRDATAQFTCAVNSEDNTSLDDLWENTILPYIDAQVQAIYGAEHMARIDADAQYIPTANSIVASVQYRVALGATDVVESRVTVGYDEDTNIDFTGAYDGNSLGIYADDPPAAVRLRISRRVTTVLGVIGPKSRLGGGGSFSGAGFSGGGAISAAAPGWVGVESDPVFGGRSSPGGDGLQPSQGGGQAKSEGWNLVKNTSNATTTWLGHEDMQFAVTLLEETVVERYVERPS